MSVIPVISKNQEPKKRNFDVKWKRPIWQKRNLLTKNILENRRQQKHAETKRCSNDWNGKPYRSTQLGKLAIFVEFEQVENENMKNFFLNISVN